MPLAQILDTFRIDCKCYIVGVIIIVKQNQQHSVVITDDDIFVMTVILSHDDRSKMKLEFKCWSPQKLLFESVAFSGKKRLYSCEKEEWILETFQFLKMDTRGIPFESVLKPFSGQNVFLVERRTFLVTANSNFFFKTIWAKILGIFFSFLSGTSSKTSF